VLSLALATVAVAAPPSGRSSATPRDLHPATPKLDLRAPVEWAAEFARSRFDDRSRFDEPWPALAAEGPAVRPMSRMEQLANRFRREGLPIAKLFESHSALVSLGLNQRGKPGLWLIQKIP
jgi:hypothetical protein